MIPQQRGLAATGGAKQGEELAAGDSRRRVERGHPAGETLGDASQADDRRSGRRRVAGGPPPPDAHGLIPNFLSTNWSV